MENFERLLGDLENEILQAKRSAFIGSDNVIVNKSVLLDMVARMRASYPVALKEAASVLKERDDILGKAEAYANETMDKAEEHARQLISDSEIVKQAKQNAEEIRAEATENYERLDYDSRLHAYNLLDSVEVTLKDALKTINESKKNLIQN